jgi:glycyl-tRNA synthetase beta chain
MGFARSRPTYRYTGARSMPDLLLELFSEEIPARMQARAAEDLRRLVTDGLVEAGLTYEGAAAHAGPRRLTLDLRGLPAQTPARREERKGPRADAPEKAVEGFLRSTGLTRDRLVERPDKKGAVLFAVIDIPGRPAEAVVAEVVEQTVRGFPWPKSMRWGSGALRWVRPLQSILCLLSDEAGARVVDLEIDGIRAGDVTRGHRFMAPEPIRVTGFEHYAARLAAAKVVLSAEERAERIRADAATLAFAQGLEVVEDPGLLAETAGLAEWPVCLMGAIDAQFLDLPPEVLRTAMKVHQKFFSLRDPATGRIPRFVTAANMEAADGGARILAGNQRVLTARLSDAAFFWKNDLATPLEEFRRRLESVTFHGKLGTQADRIDRIAALAREIAPAVGADPELAERAARLAKLDLASAMVGEFPELQGAMGRYYAEAAGEPAEVAAACAEHYAPLGPSDAVPTAPVSVAVALADKIDMLTGFWAIDEKPTGSKDPFALRRAALGVVRVVLENGLRVTIRHLLLHSHSSFLSAFRKRRALCFKSDTGSYRSEVSYPLAEPARENAFWFIRKKSIFTEDLFSEAGVDIFDENGFFRFFQLEDIEDSFIRFVNDRLKVALRDRGVRHDVIDACFALPDQDDLTLVVARVEALQAFLGADDGANLLAGRKRAANILAAEERKDGVEYSLDPDPKFADSDAERALFAALDRAEAALGPALEREDFTAAMAALAALRAPIDAFFDVVTVNDDNAILRRNRLCLLRRVCDVMAPVADLSKLEG